MKPNTPTIDSINLTLTLDQWETLLTLVGREQCVNEKAAGLALVNGHNQAADRFIAAAELLASIGHALELGGAIAAGVPVTGGSSGAVCGCCDAEPELQDAGEYPTCAACGCSDAAERAEAAAAEGPGPSQRILRTLFVRHGDLCSPPTNEDDELPTGWRCLHLAGERRYFGPETLEDFIQALDRAFHRQHRDQAIDLVL